MSAVTRIERRQRSVLGNFFKWLFIVFNVLMLFWFVSGLIGVSAIRPASDAERAGYAIGATIGFSMLFALWTFGALLLGIFALLTRGELVVVEKPIGTSSLSSADDADAARRADEVVARYLKAQQAQARAASPAPMATRQQPGFGRRRLGA